MRRVEHVGIVSSIIGVGGSLRFDRCVYSSGCMYVIGFNLSYGDM